MNYKYCSRCGVLLEMKESGGRQRPTCPQCGFIVFLPFSIGAGGLLIQDGRVLLIQRKLPPGAGQWTLPSGYVEIDETPDEAVVREVFEESGLRTRAVGLIAVWHTPRQESQDAWYVFGMQLDGPLTDLKPGGDGVETQRAGFFAPSEFAALGEMGPLSRYSAEHFLPGQAVLFPDPIAYQLTAQRPTPSRIGLLPRQG